MNILKPKNGWVVLAIIIGWQAIASLFFVAGPYPALTALEVGTLPEERFGYQANELATWFESLEESGRATYQQFQLLDVLNAALGAIALSIGLGFVLPRLFPADHWVQSAKWLPTAIFGLELIENLLLYLNSANFPEPTLTGIVPLVTLIKLIFGFGSMLLFVITAVWLAVRQFRNRN